MKNKIQGDYPLEVRFVDETRVYLNFWDMTHGNDVCCQIKDGKLFKFVHNANDIETDMMRDESQIEDHLELKEISLNEFLELVQSSILQTKP